MKYRDGCKYQLWASIEVALPEFQGVLPRAEVGGAGIHLRNTGWLRITDGYAWDGPSGPTWDTASSMRASLVHDALYQLMEDGELALEHREKADEAFYRLLLEDGMWQWRAWLWFKSVRAFGGPLARKPKKILEAP